jgi:hypothetical protein
MDKVPALNLSAISAIKIPISCSCEYCEQHPLYVSPTGFVASERIVQQKEPKSLYDFDGEVCFEKDPISKHPNHKELSKMHFPF